jgi:hypothetical protein
LDRTVEVKASVGQQWKTNRPSSTADERKQRRPWIVFAIVDIGLGYVIWKLDTGTNKRIGDGWAIAARVSATEVVSVKEFPESSRGFPLVFVTRRSDGTCSGLAR